MTAADREDGLVRAEQHVLPHRAPSVVACCNRSWAEVLDHHGSPFPGGSLDLAPCRRSCSKLDKMHRETLSLIVSLEPVYVPTYSYVCSLGVEVPLKHCKRCEEEAKPRERTVFLTIFVVLWMMRPI